MVSNISYVYDINSYFINEDKSKIDNNNFSVILEETNIMLKQESNTIAINGADEYISILSRDIDQNANINKSKIQESVNPYKQNNLPDWVYAKTKNILKSTSSNFVPAKTTHKVPVEFEFNTSLKWLSTMITLNAIAMSNGQKDMKINEDIVNWDKVFNFTTNGFKNNMKQEHTDEMAEKYKMFLNSPASPYYFYSDEEKKTMISQYKTDNYKLNNECFNAAKLLTSNQQG